MKTYERVSVPAIRKRALDRCTQWILDRQETSGDWAGIFPPMLNSIIALTLQGYEQDSDPVKKGLQAIESFAWEDDEGLRIQAVIPPFGIRFSRPSHSSTPVPSPATGDCEEPWSG